MKEILTIICTSIVGLASAGALWQFLQFLIKRLDSKKERSLIRGMESLHRVYTAITALQDMGADRVVLFAGHNSGGIPRANSPFYTTALHWAIKQPYRDRFPDYNSMPVDAEFIGMLLQMEREGFVKLQPESLKPGLLSEMFSAEGITDCIKLFLGVVENKFMYLSVSKYGGHFSAMDITRIRLKAQAVANEIKITKAL